MLSAFLGGILTADRIDTPFISGKINLTRRTVRSGAKRAPVSAGRTRERALHASKQNSAGRGIPSIHHR